MNVKTLTQDINITKAKRIRTEFYRKERAKGITSTKILRSKFEKKYPNLSTVIRTYERGLKSKEELEVRDAYAFIRAKYLSEENIIRIRAAMGPGTSMAQARAFITTGIKQQLGFKSSERIDTAFMDLYHRQDKPIPTMVDGKMQMVPKSDRTKLRHVRRELERMDAHISETMRIVQLEYDRRYTKRGTKRIRGTRIKEGNLGRLTFFYRGLQSWYNLIKDQPEVTEKQLKKIRDVLGSYTGIATLERILWDSGYDIYYHAFRSGNPLYWGSDAWIEDIEIASDTLIKYIMMV